MTNDQDRKIRGDIVRSDFTKPRVACITRVNLFEICGKNMGLSATGASLAYTPEYRLNRYSLTAFVLHRPRA